MQQSPWLGAAARQLASILTNGLPNFLPNPSANGRFRRFRLLPVALLLLAGPVANASAQTTANAGLAAGPDAGLPPEWALSRLYTRPFLWGTTPERLTWAKKQPVLLFLWNESGRRFLDLYAWNPATKRRTRLTSLEGADDPFNPLPDEKDEKLKTNRLPDAGLSSFALREDGQQVAYLWRGDIYLVSTQGGQPFRLTKTKGSESNPAYSPDGKRLSFVRGGELFVQDLATGQLTQLTEASQGGLQSYSWSPDGTRLVVSFSTPGSTRSQVLPNYSGKFVTARPFPRSVAGDESGPVSRFVLSADGNGKPVKLDEALSATKPTGSQPDWSPDGKRLAVLYTSGDFHTKQLWVYDAATGKGKSIFEDKDARWVHSGDTLWSPDSNSLLVQSDRSGFIHLWRVSVSGGEPLAVTKGNWELDTERFGYPPQWVADRIVYCSTEQGTNQRHLYSVAPDGSAKRQLSSGEGLRVGQISHDGRYLAELRADLNSPWDLYVDGSRVTTSPREGFTSMNWPKTQFISFPSAGDGQTVQAKLLLPDGYDPARKDGKRWPCLFFIHGAGIASSVLQQWGSYQEYRYVFNAYMAKKGYVIMDLDYRGSSGYGRNWRTDVFLHMGGKDLDDVLGAVNYLQKLENVDLQRLGIWGVSYGGFMTNMALFLKPGVFKAGSSWAAVNDWENYNAGYTRQRLTTPAENPEAYRRSSPIYFSGNLQDHLQIVHGVVDSNVLFQDAVQLTEKLIYEGKPFEEIFYPQEDHGFQRDETLIDSFKRAASFFDRHLAAGK